MPTPCAPWVKGTDCSFNLRTARIVLSAFLSCLLIYCIYLTVKVSRRNKYRASRPVTCLVLLGVSLLCDIVEQIAVVSNMIPTDWSKWHDASYGSNTFDAVGDMFLMLSLFYFATIWCDNIALLRHKSGNKENRYCGLSKIYFTYGFIFIGTVPLSITFAVSSYMDGLYDSVAIAYMAWGAFTGILLLTPVSLYMEYVIRSLPKSVQDQESFKQLKFQTNLNFVEQMVWNLLLVIALVTFTSYLSGGSTNGALIGTAAVCSQLSWLLIHVQVLGFFAFVPRARIQSPTFDEHLLRTLLDGEENVEQESRKHVQLQEFTLNDEDAVPLAQT